MSRHKSSKAQALEVEFISHMELGVRFTGSVSNQRMLVECLTCNSGMRIDITYDDYNYLDRERLKWIDKHLITDHEFKKEKDNGK